jgi:hypothetical protein
MYQRSSSDLNNPGRTLHKMRPTGRLILDFPVPIGFDAVRPTHAMFSKGKAVLARPSARTRRQTLEEPLGRWSYRWTLCRLELCTRYRHWLTHAALVLSAGAVGLVIGALP